MSPARSWMVPRARRNRHEQVARGFSGLSRSRGHIHSGRLGCMSDVSAAPPPQGTARCSGIGASAFALVSFHVLFSRRYRATRSHPWPVLVEGRVAVTAARTHGLFGAYSAAGGRSGRFDAGGCAADARRHMAVSHAAMMMQTPDVFCIAQQTVVNAGSSERYDGAADLLEQVKVPFERS